MTKKLCKNCVHTRLWERLFGRWLCHRRGTEIPNSRQLLDGSPELIEEYEYCLVERQSWSHRETCGPEGNFYKEKT